jgi:hypothetical protein
METVARVAFNEYAHTTQRPAKVRRKSLNCQMQAHPWGSGAQANQTTQLGLSCQWASVLLKQSAILLWLVGWPEVGPHKTVKGALHSR